MSVKKIRILFVEDNEDDFALVFRELTKGKFEIEYELTQYEKDFKKALEKKWDAIISDYALPSFNGYEALKICNEKGIDIPFIIVSGTVGEDIAVDMMKAGAKDYIMKKSLKRLLPAVEREIFDAKIREKNRLIALEREVLFTIGKDIMTTTSLDELLEKIYMNIKKVIYAENCFIALYDFERDEISFPFFVDKFDTKPAPLKKRKTLTDYVIRKGKSLLSSPEILKRLEKESEIELIGTDSESWLGVPLIIQSKPIGALVVQSYEKNIIYTEYDKNFLEAIANDIAVAIERRKSIELIIENETRLNEALKIANAGHWEYDVASNTFTFNDNFYRIFKTTAKEVGGYKMSPEEYAKKFLHPDDMDLVRIENEAALKTNDPNFSRQLEHRIVFPNGEVGYISVIFHIEKDASGKTIRTYGINQNITERKISEAALKESEERYRVFINSTNDMAFLKDDTFRYILVNDANAKFFNKKINDIIGKEDFDLMPEKSAKNCRKSDIEALNSEYVIINEEQVGERIYETHKFKVPLYQGKFGVGGYIRDVTERKWAEVNLRKSEEHYRTLLTAIPDLMFRMDGEGRFMDYHADDLKQLFVPPEKFLGKHYKDILPPVIIEKYEKTIKKVKRTGEIGKFEYEGLLPNNELHYYEARITCYGDECVSIIRDITERKKADEALKESEERFRVLIESMSEGVLRGDVNDTIIFANKSACDMFGYNQEELIGKVGYEILVVEEDRYIIIEKNKLRQNLVTDSYEVRGRKKNGEIIWLSVNGAPIKDEKGKVIGSVGILSDITHRKKSEEAIRESEERFRKLFEDSPFGIALVGSDLKFLRVNKGFCDMMGYSEKELNSITFKDITHPDYLANDIKNVKKLFNGDISLYNTEKRYIRKDKSIKWGEVNVTIVKDNKGDFLYLLAMIEDITARKLAEEAVRESEEHFRNIVNTAEAAYFRINREGLFEEVNHSWLRMHKYSSADEIIGKHFLTTQVDRDINNAKVFVNELLKGKPIETGEFSRRCKDGSIGYHTFSISPVIENGKITGIEGFLIDTTEKKKTLEELKASQERYVTLIETMNEGLILVDNDDVIQFVNKRECEIFGYEPEELIGRVGYKIMIAEEDQHIILEKNKKRQSSLSDSYEVRAVKKNGEKIWININGAPVKDIDGKVIGSVGIITDITERKQVDEELKKLSRAVEQSPASIVITDIKGNIEYVNPKFVSLTGYMPEEVIGGNPRILKSGKTNDSEYKKLWNTIISGKDWIGEFQNKKKNGELYWESAIISPVKNTAGKITHFLAIKEDITEKKQREMELIRAKLKAEESERLKSSFLANMSHELRTPMVGILGFAELMKDLADNPELKDFADNITKSGKRLLETLNLILDLSRIEAGKLEIKTSEVNITQLAKEVYKNYVPEAEKKKMKIKFSSTNENVICKIDERMIWESINNLINNALKYTKAGEVKVNLSTDKNNEKIYIKIKDTGIGIPRESYKTIFEEFRQVSEGYSRGFEGTGLGLTITKNFIEKNGGKISVESEIGLGSEFTIELPVYRIIDDNADIKVTEDSAIKLTPEKKDIKILCVDDDSFTREYLGYILKSYYKLYFAENGNEAIEMAKSEDFSLILMDINLGKGMDGIETARKINKLPGYEKIPVIALTAFAMKGDREEFLRNGMKNYVSKPFKSNELIKIIEEVISSKK